MDEAHALWELRNGSQEALGWFIDHYTPYVSTVAGNIIGPYMSREDIEETVADVFVSLWQNAGKLTVPPVKNWLGCVARNGAKNKLRELGRELPLEDDMLLLPGDGPETELQRREQQRLVDQAVLGLKEPEREIFLRHYFYGQKVSIVAEEMGLNISTVKTIYAGAGNNCGMFWSGNWK